MPWTWCCSRSRGACQGDTLVQKAPAATIGQLAAVLKGLFEAENEVRVIGTRHGEKKHETLLNREEMARAEDLGEYYRVAADTRDLNYEKFFEKGESQITGESDYTSANTRRLNDDELRELLLGLPFIRDQLRAAGLSKEDT